MSDTSWKPTSYPSLSPYLVTSGAQQVIDFAKAAFGAVELRRFDTPDGKVMHAEIKIDDSVVMLSDGSEEFPPHKALLHLYVPNVDEVYQRALKAGRQGRAGAEDASWRSRQARQRARPVRKQLVDFYPTSPVTLVVA
jgi:uncharacterized glyoxalase superfamily protein PhnB